MIINVKTQKDNLLKTNLSLKNQVKDKKSKFKDKIMCYNYQKIEHISKYYTESRKDNRKLKNKKILS